MTNPNELIATERKELIQRAYKLTGDLLAAEKRLYELQQAQMGIGVALVRRYDLTVTEAARIVGMTRQRLTGHIQDLRRRENFEVQE